jgi:hypothetical protein
LDDGRYEQRYQVTANVLFRLQSSAIRSGDVRCAIESRELALTEFTGVAGFQTVVRVRSADPAALDVSAANLTSTGESSGR